MDLSLFIAPPHPYTHLNPMSSRLSASSKMSTRRSCTILPMLLLSLVRWSSTRPGVPTSTCGARELMRLDSAFMLVPPMTTWTLMSMNLASFSVSTWIWPREGKGGGGQADDQIHGQRLGLLSLPH